MPGPGTVTTVMLADGTIATVDFADGSVTYVKMQAVGANKLLGSVAGGVVSEIALTARLVANACPARNALRSTKAGMRLPPIE